jgi:ATP-dependent protease ClpP protease subunit
MSLYDEKPANPKAQSYEKEEPSLYETVSEQMATLMDFDDSVIYLTTEIDETTLTDLMIRIRAILKNRPEEKADEPVNIVINSPGGNFFEMFGIIDYFESLSVKVNTICRGQAMSAAAVILALGTAVSPISVAANFNYIFQSFQVPFILMGMYETLHRLYETRSVKFFCLKFDEDNEILLNIWS